MASKRKDRYGYECNWAEKPPEDLECLICELVARDPYRCTTVKCGKVFCNNCRNSLYRRSVAPHCPNCGEKLNTCKDGRGANMINNLKVQCDYMKNGCKWTNKLEELEAHLQSVDHTLTNCTNGCSNDGQIVRVLRRNLQNHLKRCPRRKYQCPHCKEIGEYQERTTSHLKTCLEVEVSCPNDQCPVSISRREVSNHRSICGYEPVSCKYAAVGCKETPLRKHLREHEELCASQSSPLRISSAHPNVTFYEEPQEKEFTSSGGHTNFMNGVEVTVFPNTIPPNSTLKVKVQPAFASSNVFVVPKGFNSASPAYLISCNQNVTITVTMEHHARACTSKRLTFLQANSTPNDGQAYKYEEVLESEGRSEFISGENKGRLANGHVSGKFLKVGSSIDPNKPALECNLYTVRVYRSLPETVGDRLTIICISLSGQLYEKFLQLLDNKEIPSAYPEVSTKRADRTTIRNLYFVKDCATLEIKQLNGWSVMVDKKKIYKNEVDEPELVKLNPETIHDYPPRITCRFHPEWNTSEGTDHNCLISFSGMEPKVEFNIPLIIPNSMVGVDTTTLKNAADKLRKYVNHTELGSTVQNIVSLINTMTDALRSISISKLAVHTDSINTDVKTVQMVSMKVAQECSKTIPTLSNGILKSISDLELFSHQFCQVTKVKLKYCQDISEKETALEELVQIGTNLLNVVDSLLNYMNVLNDIQDSATSKRLQEDDHVNESVTPEYQAIVACTPQLIAVLAQGPIEISEELFANGMISHETYEKMIYSQAEIPRQKSRQLVLKMTKLVKIDASNFDAIIEMLVKPDFSKWTKVAVTALLNERSRFTLSLKTPPIS